MTGQYHGGQSMFAIYLVKIYDNVTAFFDEMAYLMIVMQTTLHNPNIKMKL